MGFGPPRGTRRKNKNQIERPGVRPAFFCLLVAVAGSASHPAVKTRSLERDLRVLQDHCVLVAHAEVLVERHGAGYEHEVADVGQGW